MTDAFVYDAIRTPRGKGKKDGSLHEVKPVNLLAGVLSEIQNATTSILRPSMMWSWVWCHRLVSKALSLPK